VWTSVALSEDLYHRNGHFDADCGDMTVEDKLDFMESFVRVTPMAIKRGEMVFLCNCGEAYSIYGCEHSGVLSMLWNPDMEFPDVERSAKLKAKESKTPSNPFAAVPKRKMKKADLLLAREQPRVMWNPVIQGYSSPVAESGTSMAANSRSKARAQHQARRLFIANPSLNLS
jgi:hypothetical protein